MILESAHKRIRQATLLTLASVATLVGQSGPRAPSGRMTTAPHVEQKASPVVKKAPLPSAQQPPQKKQREDTKFPGHLGNLYSLDAGIEIFK